MSFGGKTLDRISFSSMAWYPFDAATSSTDIPSLEGWGGTRESDGQLSVINRRTSNMSFLFISAARKRGEGFPVRI